MPDRTPQVHSRSTRVPLCGQMRRPHVPCPLPLARHVLLQLTGCPTHGTHAAAVPIPLEICSSFVGPTGVAGPSGAVIFEDWHRPLSSTYYNFLSSFIGVVCVMLQLSATAAHHGHPPVPGNSAPLTAPPVDPPLDRDPFRTSHSPLPIRR